MPTPKEIRSLVDSYVKMMCDSDIEGILALYADDATAQDPVGGEVQKGKEALRNFYALTAPALQVELNGPVCVAGRECAFLLLAELTMGDNKQYLDATDIFSFNDEGKITSMKAYWDPAELRPTR
ncbi:MAG: Nuclear transport factor 2 [bacterium]|nr:Nuclear transport factor 2 [bacterium]